MTNGSSFLEEYATRIKHPLSPVERKGAAEVEEAAMSLPDLAKRPLFGARLEPRRNLIK